MIRMKRSKRSGKYACWNRKQTKTAHIVRRIVQKPQPTENRAKKVANRPLLIPRMVFENGKLWEFNWKRMLRLAMRRAKTQKMVFYEGGNEQENSSSRKSQESGGTIVIVDDATQDISTWYGSTWRSWLGDGSLLINALMGTSSVVIIRELNHDAP